MSTIPSAARRAKSPTVSSRLYEPTAASRSRATANADTYTAAHNTTNNTILSQPSGPSVAPFSTSSNPNLAAQRAPAAAVPLSLRGLGGGVGARPQSTQQRPLSPSSSTVTRPISSSFGSPSHLSLGASAGALGDVSQGQAVAGGEGGTRRTPVRARRTTSAGPSAHTSAAASRSTTPVTARRAAAAALSSSAFTTSRHATPNRSAAPSSLGRPITTRSLYGRTNTQQQQQQHYYAQEEEEVVMSPYNDGAARAPSPSEVPSAPSPARFASTSRSPSRPSASGTAASSRRTASTPTTTTARRAISPSASASPQRGGTTAAGTSRSASAAATRGAAGGAVGGRAVTAKTTTPRRAASSSSTATTGAAAGAVPKKKVARKSSSPARGAADLHMSTLEMSPMAGEYSPQHHQQHEACADSPVVTPKSPEQLLEELLAEEDNARTDIRVEEDVTLWGCYTSLLTAHNQQLDAKLANVRLVEELREKAAYTEELKEKTAFAVDEMAYLRKATDAIKLEVLEQRELEKKLNALSNFSKINDAKMRQKQATMECLQRTTSDLANSCDLLIAMLYVEVEALAELAKGCKEREAYSQSHARLPPLECMAALTEVDFMREIHFESKVAESEAFGEEGRALNEAMKEVVARGQEALVVADAEWEQEKVLVRRQWAGERKGMERDVKVLRKEITDLNFQIRRGTNIKSLSQLPSGGGHQLDRDRARELFLDVETHKAEVEKLRADEAALRERLLTLREYHGNKEGECMAVVTRTVKEREQLLAIKDSLREEVVTLQRGALTFHNYGEGGDSAALGYQQRITNGSPSGNGDALKAARPPSALDDIDEDDYVGHSEGSQQHVRAPSPQQSSSAPPSAAAAVLSADEALRILSAMEEEDKARAARRDRLMEMTSSGADGGEYPYHHHHHPQQRGGGMGGGMGDLAYFSVVDRNADSSNMLNASATDGYAMYGGRSSSSANPQILRATTPNRARTPNTANANITSTTAKAPKPSALLDRLCKPTKKFASYVDARVSEDNFRRAAATQMNDARPDARRYY